MSKYKLGEVVRLTNGISIVKHSGMVSYAWQEMSRYVCVQEESTHHRCILVKVLGKCNAYDINTVGGEPFCKDNKDEGFLGDNYLSYRFPDVDELRNVLDIVRSNETVRQALRDAQMHIDPDGTFWVRDTVRSLLGHRKIQYYDVLADQLKTVSNNSKSHQRLTIAYVR